MMAMMPPLNDSKGIQLSRSLSIQGTSYLECFPDLQQLHLTTAHLRMLVWHHLPKWWLPEQVEVVDDAA